VSKKGRVRLRKRRIRLREGRKQVEGRKGSELEGRKGQVEWIDQFKGKQGTVEVP
jgi:hypothetical protein